MAVRDDTDILIAPKAENIPTAVSAPPRPADLPNRIEDGAGSEVIKIKVNNNRYNVRDKGWEISAFDEGVGNNPQIESVKGQFGKWPEMHPLLLIDGIVVKVDGLYLVSQKTLNDIEASENPHYDIRVNGEVMGRTIGATIPVIEIHMANPKESGTTRDVLNLRAGVKSVDYVWESDMVEGIPQGLIDHIHWIFGLPGAERPEDHFEIYDFGFTKDFGVSTIKTVAIGLDGKVDRSKLTQLLTASKAKVNGIISEFNTIKGIYYSGKIPEGSAKSVVEYKKRAHAFDPDHERPDKEYVVKTSGLVTIQAGPVEGVHNAVAAVATLATTPVSANTENPALTGTAGESNILIGRWRSYDFTGTQKSFIKYSRLGVPHTTTSTVLFGLVSTANPNIVTIEGKSYNVGLAWPPEICDKARFIGEISNGGFLSYFNGSAQTAQRVKLTEYFGILTMPEWIKLNAQRKAELLHLADKILELERADGTVY